jgi:hypothetical protein
LYVAPGPRHALLDADPAALTVAESQTIVVETAEEPDTLDAE